MSSARAIQNLKNICKPSKIGHAGTLDPFASGLLIVGIGKATRLIEYATNKHKVYEFEVTWGKSTDTFDLTGEIVQESLIRPDNTQIENIISKFLGEIEQTPPSYSAIKINGIRAYKLARDNIDFHLTSKRVNAYELYIIKNVFMQNNTVTKSKYIDKTTFYLKCGKGFYVRSLAVDLASALNTLGYVSKLRRIESGKFSVKNAISVDYINELCNKGGDKSSINDLMHPICDMLDDIPVYHISNHELDRIIHGHSIMICQNMSLSENDIVQVIKDDAIIALCYYSAGALYPKKCFYYTN